MIREDDISSFEVDYSERVTSKKADGTASYELSLYVYNEKDDKRYLPMFRRLVNFIIQAKREKYNV